MSTLCVGPSASGSGDGSDWNNIKQFGELFTRGDTWYLRSGTYSGAFAMSSATSGTILNTIRVATETDHGPENGWEPSMAGVSNFTSSDYCIGLLSQYWLFDGAVGYGDGSVEDYGIKLTSTGTVFGASPVLAISGNCSHITFRHISMTCPLASTGHETRVFDERSYVYSGTVSTNITISYCKLYGGVVGVCFSGNGVTDQSNVVEHCWLEEQGGIEHSESVQLVGTKNVTLRYNTFKNIRSPSTTYIEPQSNGGPICDGIFVYGNTFVENGEAFGTNNPALLSLTSSETANNIQFYNNTAHGINGSDSGLGLSSGGNDCTNVYVRNNIWQSCSGVPGGTSVGTWSNNRLNTGDTVQFANSVAGDFHLSSDTAISWYSLSSPYEQDPDGVTRTSSIGAYQYTLSAPTNLTATALGATAIRLNWE